MHKESTLLNISATIHLSSRLTMELKSNFATVKVETQSNQTVKEVSMIQNSFKSNSAEPSSHKKVPMQSVNAKDFPRYLTSQLKHSKT